MWPSTASCHFDRGWVTSPYGHLCVPRARENRPLFRKHATCLSAFCATAYNHHCTSIIQSPSRSTDLFRIRQATIFSASK